MFIYRKIKKKLQLALINDPELPVLDFYRIEVKNGRPALNTCYRWAKEVRR